jgi:sugar/nucleoside kinase (ribokinase family)
MKVYNYAHGSREIKYDIVAIGEPIVDLIKDVSIDELNQIMPLGFKANDSNMLGKNEADDILKVIGEHIVIPGGSEANVMVAFASLGGKAGFHGVLADDRLGQIFK